MEQAGGRKGKGKGTPPPPVHGRGPPKSFQQKRPPVDDAAQAKSMEEQLADRRARLSKVGPRDEITVEEAYRRNMEQDNLGKKNKSAYFASAADQWMFLPGMDKCTFPTEFMELGQGVARLIAAVPAWEEIGNSDEEREARLLEKTNSEELNELKVAIDDKLRVLSWQKAFVKLTTFSAKDSPLVLQEASRMLSASDASRQQFLAKSRGGRLRMLSESMTDALSVSIEGGQAGEKVVRMLATSPRVKQDLLDSLNSLTGPLDCRANVPNLCLRLWHAALPIWTEFRGFVYKGNLNAVGQYVHNMFFTELQDESTRAKIQTDILEEWRQHICPILVESHPTCIIDFAWSESGFPWRDGKNVILIEVNPWNPDLDLSMSTATTGILNLKANPEHLELVKNGPFALVVKTEDVEITLSKGQEALLDQLAETFCDMRACPESISPPECTDGSSM